MDNIKNKSLLSILCEPGELTLAIDNPADGSVVGYIPLQSETEIDECIRKSRLAQKLWQKRPAKERSHFLYRWYELARQAGMPEDVLQVVVHHSPEKVGDIFTHHPMIRKLSFTGSDRCSAFHELSPGRAVWPCCPNSAIQH
ncbi:aldehyde dehydrogenase family protein [Endozoicomonas acroporae]|uniref:aldehyde dehydrogenase family protein n=1 Tax=Endozoicomonas acroporae TaxID=1701104 RepID=UPI0019D5F26C|nr:aldehyde dehydrogenase family protein [Endozoicomonas acroporae]